MLDWIKKEQGNSDLKPKLIHFKPSLFEIFLSSQALWTKLNNQHKIYLILLCQLSQGFQQAYSSTHYSFYSRNKDNDLSWVSSIMYLTHRHPESLFIWPLVGLPDDYCISLLLMLISFMISTEEETIHGCDVSTSLWKMTEQYMRYCRRIFLLMNHT